MKTITLFLAVVLAIGFSISTYLKMPVVYFSNTTGQCKFVEIDGQKFNCSVIKENTKYEKVWIK